LKTITLNGKWNLYFNLESGNMPSTIDEVKEQKWPRIDAVVPGNVELDLVRAGIEEDPFYSQNLYNFRKYEFYQWWFEKEFKAPEDFRGKDVFLLLKGLNTFGSIWINGEIAGQVSNMLIEHELDITNLIKIGDKNHIAIRIESPINKVRDKEFPVNVTSAGNIDEMVWLRMPPHSFGWDIAPRLLSAGIWRDIEIVAREKTYIKEVYYATRDLNANKAELVVKFRFKTDKPILDDFSVRITGKCEDSIIEGSYKTKFCSDEAVLVVPNPKLWWPKGYGKQHLYDMEFQLLYKGEVVDTYRNRIGIRLFEIETEYDSDMDNNEFKIWVNGTPVMAKGTNWVALDALHSRDKDRLKKAHDMLDDLGCNIVRCWGGNVYEDHEFFDLCDERGIMVWQDFTLACGIYPQNDEFCSIIENEATAIVKKLRNHPSLLLWAGDNEIDGMYYWNKYCLPTARYNRISREILPRVVGSHDPFRMFIPSSPYIPDHITGDLSVPEQHNWGPRDYFKGDFYKHSTAHFISEIGYHGCPAVSSIKKFIAPDKLWPFMDNDDWDTHNTDYIKAERRGYNRNKLMADQVEIMFGYVPDNLEEFALASQISQAEAKKFFIEMVRLKKWRRTGIIWWNLLDCWPQFSDAIVDYYFVKKLAYHYIKRVQQPICLMIDELQNWEHKVVLGNDSNETVEVSYAVEDGDTGELLLSGKTVSKANENKVVGAIRMLPGTKKLFILRWKIGNTEYGNHYISGYVPFELEQYKRWLKKIETLPQLFDNEWSWR